MENPTTNGFENSFKYNYDPNQSLEYEDLKRELSQIRQKKPSDISDRSNLKTITVIIPCHNEEKGLPDVINDIPYERLAHLGYAVDVLVIDNNSNDNTNPVARSLGARVIFEPKKGKGRAIKTGFLNIHPDAEYIVMLDGDATYKAKEIPRLIEPLESGFADVIIGSRLEGKMNGKSMEFSHRAANWFFTFITRRFYFANVTDTCTGYFAWTRNAVDKLNGYITSKGFAIEAEMITKMAKLGLRIFSVPITYDRRTGNSKLAPVGDGIKITRMLFKNISWRPPHPRIRNQLSPQFSPVNANQTQFYYPNPSQQNVYEQYGSGERAPRLEDSGEIEIDEQKDTEKLAIEKIRQYAQSKDIAKQENKDINVITQNMEKLKGQVQRLSGIEDSMEKLQNQLKIMENAIKDKFNEMDQIEEMPDSSSNNSEKVNIKTKGGRDLYVSKETDEIIKNAIKKAFEGGQKRKGKAKN